MARNNIRILTPNEFSLMNDKYIFELIDNNIVVKIKNYNRATYHDATKPFSINAKGIRKVCFSMDAIEIWKSISKNNSPTLLSVQQAVNKLIITFQQVNEDNVKKILSGRDIKIKKLY